MARNSKLSRILSLERTPAILALLLAATAWCVSRVADRVVALPLLEYSDATVSRQVLAQNHLPNCPASKTATSYVVEISDISKQRAFSNITLEFYSEARRPVTEVAWINLPPGLTGASGGATCKDGAHQDFQKFTLNELEPGWSGEAIVWVQGGVRPVLLYTLLGGDAGESGAPHGTVYLAKRDLTTWIVRHEFTLYYCTILCLVVLIAWYLFTYEKRR